MANLGPYILLLVCPALYAEGAASRLIQSFETPEDAAAVKTASARATRVTAHATDGKYALEIAFDSARGSAELRPAARDWRPFGAVSLSVTNVSQEPAAFAIEVEDSSGARTRGETKVTLLPGEQGRYALPLDSPDPLDMGMRGEPNLPGFQLLVSDHVRLALGDVAGLRIATAEKNAPRKLVIDDVRLAPGVSYDRIMDRFGQYTREDWPGKLKSEAELATRREREEADLRQHPALADRDEYGGWASGPKLQATGFFRAEKRDGKWWLVTPGGRLFFSLGFNEVDAHGMPTVVESRERMFTWLPKSGEPLASHYAGPMGHAPVGLKIKLFRGRAFNFYTANLERKYGTDWHARWRESTLVRMRAWGFNTIGNWSDTALQDMHKVPYTALIDIEGEVAEITSGEAYWRHMYDVFDPRFAEIVERSVGQATARTRNDPWCIGYFVDNELTWGGMRTPRSRYGLALGALALGPESPAKRAFVEQLRARYTEIQALNTAWGASVASWDALVAKPYEVTGEPPAGMHEDLGRFVTALATRYFETIRDALRRHDTNHMYLGNRFAWHTKEAVLAAARFCDVMSFNIYRALPEPDDPSTFEGYDRPIMIGEFHMGAVDRGMFHTGLVAARNQAERARMYQDYVRAAARNPKLVGCHFFKYVDESVTGRPGDGENYNIGFVSVSDTPYPEMVQAGKEVHSEVYKLRTEAR